MNKPVIQAISDTINSPMIKDEDDAKAIRTIVAINPKIVNAIEYYKAIKNNPSLLEKSKTPIITADEIRKAMEEEKTVIVDTKEEIEAKETKETDDDNVR